MDTDYPHQNYQPTPRGSRTLISASSPRTAKLDRLSLSSLGECAGRGKPLVLAIIVAGLILCVPDWSGSVLYAQASPPPPPGAAGDYPNFPLPFFRGNSPGDRGGGYLNLWTFVPILGWFFLWIYSTNWVHEDSSALKIRNDLWNSLMIGGGVVGFLLFFLSTSLGMGFCALLLAQGVPLGSYIFKRNERVPESAKVMTPRHLRNVLLRTLARIGIDIAPKGIRDSAIGPPIRFIGKTRKGGDAELANRQVENSKGYLAARELIYDAILRRATDVHLEPTEDELSIRYRIDGVLRSSEPFDRGTGDALINVFKVLSAIDITERRKAQDGSFRADMEGRDIDFRVATQGTNAGEKLSIRILDQSNSVSSLSELGMRKQLQGQLMEIIKQPHGMFLSCGPTGAGKSTTLYAALSEIDRHMVNVITVEDPIEYKMENVTQIEINTKAGQSFANSLRSILRQDPDVVMVGEIRDDETARIACQAANTGHMVFSTIHANDAITALFRMIDLGVEPFLIASSLSAIMGQRLVRKLCPDCREAYTPDPSMLKKLGLPPEKVPALYRPPKEEAPCETCGGIGYYGRIGVYELLVLNDRIRDLLRENPVLSSIKAEARKNGMLYLREEGLRLVVKGETSLEELVRVVK